MQARRATRRIPTRLIAALNRTADQFAPRGVRLYLFGSVARSFPESHRGADLDLGYECCGSECGPALHREIREAIDRLPTIRPVDLVDFDHADPGFLAAVQQHLLPLPVPPADD